MMKNICRLLACLLLVLSIGHAQVKTGFNIEGKVKGLKNGSKLFLVLKKDNKIDTISHATTKNESFVLKNVKLPQYPDFYLITMPSEFVNDLKVFINQGENIKIDGDLKKWPAVKIIGSTAHNDYLTYLKYEERAKRVVDSLGYLSASDGKQRDYSREARLPFIQKYPNSYVLPYALLVWKDWDGTDLHPVYKRVHYNKLPEGVKNSYYGQLLKEAMEIAEKDNFISPGDVFPSISVFDENSKAESILDLVKKNKLTLIDCWSSGCLSCRKEFPEVEKILAKHKSKGFGVLGISSDKDNAAWKKALAHDQTSWPDFIQDEALSLTKTFDFYGIGAYFLVDSQGKVIAFDGPSKIVRPFGGALKGEELDKKLEELLGK